MTDQVARIVQVAEGEVGTKETKSGGHWVNNSKYNRWFGRIPGYDQDGYGWPWCAAFVAWCAHEAGVASLYPKSASCSTDVSWFKEKGRFSEYPAIGAQIFFGPGGGSHTGLVVGYDSTYVYTVEGNTNSTGSAEGDGVYRKTRVRRDDYVFGYGYPEFEGGIVTADPSKKGKAGFTYQESASAPAASKPAKAEYEPFPGATYFKKRPNSDLVTRMGKRLVAEGCSAYKSGPGPQWTDADRASYAKWQRKLGYRGADADGWPGKTSWDKLKVPKG